MRKVLSANWPNCLAFPAPLPVATTAATTQAITKKPWPPTLPEQMQALTATLTSQPQTDDQIAARFTGKGKWKSRLPDLLAILAALGRARRLDDGRWLG